MKILLTGFEPFAEDTINPSEQLVKLLAGSAYPGVEFVTAVLPVESQRGPVELVRALELHQPEAVVSLGVAAGRTAISIERVAVNLLDYLIADNSGNQVVDQPIAAGGPAAYFSSLPVRRIYEAIRAAGVPVELSLTAGAFLCNQIFYVLMDHLAAKGRAIPAGFIHLPALPEMALKSSAKMPSMSLATMASGIEVAIRVIAGDEPG